MHPVKKIEEESIAPSKAALKRKEERIISSLKRNEKRSLEYKRFQEKKKFNIQNNILDRKSINIYVNGLRIKKEA